MYLSPCTLAYAKAKLDPFNYQQNELPCIPDVLDIPSQKLVTVLRGTASTGTTGFGCIMASGNWNANDTPVVWSTDSTYAASNMPSATGTGVVATWDSRFPYPSSLKRQHRSVVTALRVRYIGTELNRGGRLAMRANNVPTTSTGATFSSVASDTVSVIFPVDRKWHTILWNPAYPEPYAYDVNDYSVGTSQPTNAQLIALFEGVAAQQAYEWELIGYHELIGAGSALAVAAPTRSHTDTAGYGFVKDFLSSEATRSVGAAAWKTFLRYVSSRDAQRAMSYVGVSRPRLEL